VAWHARLARARLPSTASSTDLLCEVACAPADPTHLLTSLRGGRLTQRGHACKGMPAIAIDRTSNAIGTALLTHLLAWLLAPVGRSWHHWHPECAWHPDVRLAHQTICTLSIESARVHACACAAPPAFLLLRLARVLRRICAIHETLARPWPARRFRPGAHLPGTARPVDLLSVEAEAAAHLLARVLTEHTVRSGRRRASQIAPASAVDGTEGTPHVTTFAPALACHTFARRAWEGQHAIQAAGAVAIGAASEPIDATRLALLLRLLRELSPLSLLKEGVGN